MDVKRRCSTRECTDPSFNTFYIFDRQGRVFNFALDGGLDQKYYYSDSKYPDANLSNIGDGVVVSYRRDFVGNVTHYNNEPASKATKENERYRLEEETGRVRYYKDGYLVEDTSHDGGSKETSSYEFYSRGNISTQYTTRYFRGRKQDIREEK